MTPITSAANPSYRAWLKLALQPRQARIQRRTIAEGEHLACALLAAGHRLECALVRGGAAPRARAALLAQLAAARLPLYELAAPLYDRLGLVEHGIGVAVVLALPAQATTPLAGDALYLDGLQDPGNVGAVLRVAAGAGVRHVLAAPGAAALWAPKVMRAAQGAHLQLDLREQVGVECLRAEPLHWIGTAAAAAQSLWQARWPKAHVGWVIGAEGHGASRQALDACAQQVRIPLAPGVESLNVAAAAAVCLFERLRRRQAPH